MPRVYLTSADREKAAKDRRAAALSEHIRVYRAAHRLTQKELAKRMNVSYVVVARLESGDIDGMEVKNVFAAARETKLPPEIWLKLGGYKACKGGKADRACYDAMYIE